MIKQNRWQNWHSQVRRSVYEHISLTIISDVMIWGLMPGNPFTIK